MRVLKQRESSKIIQWVCNNQNHAWFGFSSIHYVLHVTYTENDSNKIMQFTINYFSHKGYPIIQDSLTINKQFGFTTSAI